MIHQSAELHSSPQPVLQTNSNRPPWWRVTLGWLVLLIVASLMGLAISVWVARPIWSRPIGKDQTCVAQANTDHTELAILESIGPIHPANSFQLERRALASGGIINQVMINPHPGLIEDHKTLIMREIDRTQVVVSDTRFFLRVYGNFKRPTLFAYDWHGKQLFAAKDELRSQMFVATSDGKHLIGRPNKFPSNNGELAVYDGDRGTLKFLTPRFSRECHGIETLAHRVVLWRWHSQKTLEILAFDAEEKLPIQKLEIPISIDLQGAKNFGHRWQIGQFGRQMFQHVEIGGPKAQERPMFGVLAGPHSLVLSTDAQEPLDRGGEPYWEPDQLATLVLDNGVPKSVSTDPRVIVHYHPESGVSSFIQLPLDHELILQSRHYLKAHPFAIKLRTGLETFGLAAQFDRILGGWTDSRRMSHQVRDRFGLLRASFTSKSGTVVKRAGAYLIANSPDRIAVYRILPIGLEVIQLIATVVSLLLLIASRRYWKRLLSFRWMRTQPASS